MKSFLVKIILPTILSILLFTLTNFLIIIPKFRQNVLNDKREMIMELTNTAISILSKYENDEREGILTREEAQKTATARIQYLRYGDENKDYFWITDMHPTMVVHPYRMDLIGKDLTYFEDPHGKRMFVEFVEMARKHGSGYVDYMWQWKDDSLHIVPKLSYVELFSPWQWVVGTGVYVQDVEKEISTLTGNLARISAGISTLIAVLLLYIFKQSLDTERKRIQAEEELARSEEKYRTLVEAATEGLIMLIDGKISFSNNIISKMTGFESAELTGHWFYEVIHSSSNYDIIDIFSREKVKEGQFELNMIRRNGGFLEVLVTSSTAVFYGKTVNIIIVKDISADRSSVMSVVDYQKLISTLDVGFFRANINKKGTFTYANETAIRILGCTNTAELSQIHIIRLMADSAERKELRKKLIEQGFIKNKVVKISNRQGQVSIVAISLVLHDREDHENLICDGIVEDITLREEEKTRADELIAQLQSRDIAMERPISEYMRPAMKIDAETTLQEVIATLSNGKASCLLLTAKSGDCMGIITNRDIQNRIIALGLSLENPAYLIMSAPIVFVEENTALIEAIRICETNSINHLVARNSKREVSGVVNSSDLYRVISRSHLQYQQDINRAGSVDELALLNASYRTLLRPMIKSEVSIKHITDLTSRFSDGIFRRIIELAIDDLGEPPVNFSFICLGSEGRQEETLLTDQDNAIIYEDVPDESKNEVNRYFLKLGEWVCTALDGVGYTYCAGNVMAKNPVWCQPLGTWLQYFRQWVATPEPKNLLDASIFFDFRHVYGDESFMGHLRDEIACAIQANATFLYHLAYNAYQIKPQQMPTGSLLSDKQTDLIDLKGSAIPLIMFARVYSLKHSIWHTNTVERLTTLREIAAIDDTTADGILFAYRFLMKLRFRNQVFQAENKQAVSNKLALKQLTEPEILLLKKVLSAIPDYQNKLKTDFRIGI